MRNRKVEPKVASGVEDSMSPTRDKGESKIKTFALRKPRMTPQNVRLKSILHRLLRLFLSRTTYISRMRLQWKSISLRCYDTDFADRLNCHWTVIIFVALALIVSAKQIFGRNMECWVWSRMYKTLKRQAWIHKFSYRYQRLLLMRGSSMPKITVLVRALTICLCTTQYHQSTGRGNIDRSATINGLVAY